MIFIIALTTIILLAFINKKNRFIFILLWCACVLVVGLNYDNPDYANYELAFNNASMLAEFDIFKVLDIGTKTILSTAKELGINNYPDFRLAYSIVLYILFGITIYKNCRYGALFFALYLISYIILDEIQFRNFSSFVVILPFLIYYINNQTLKGLTVFIIGDLLAFTLHFSAIFYLLFCLSMLKSKTLKIAICIATIIIGFIGFLESNLAMIDHTSHYDAPTTLGAVASCLLLAGNCFYIVHIKKQYLNKSALVFSPKIRKNFEIIQQINFLLLLLCPAVFMNATVLRIWRFTSLVNLIYILNLAFAYSGNKAETKLTVSALIYSCLIGMWFNNELGVYESFFNNPILD